LNTTRHPRRRAGAGLLALAALLLPAALAAAPSPPAKALTNTAGLGFGRFVPAGGGTITVDINGLRTRSGAVVLLASSASAARFTISAVGNDNRAFILTLPADGSVALTSGANAMALNNFVSNAPAGGLLPAGNHAISVGATLQVAPGQRPGSYSGAFPVTLEYQ
jgi:hypothetical protein